MSYLNSSLQALHRPRRTEREAEAEAHSDHVHQRAAEGAGARVRGDSLPGHLHARGARAEDRPHRGARAGATPSSHSLHLQQKALKVLYYIIIII